MKTLGKNLLAGNFDLLKISLPVKLFEPRSYLQKLADPFIFTRFLDAAAAASDPIERMKLVIAAIVAGYHRVFLKWAKPFNPILGETWQASLPDGTAIFLEQVSHHPPVSAFQMFGAHGRYYFHGVSQPSVTYKANAIKTHGKGYRCVEFADGGVIDISFPAYYIKGLLYADAPRAEISGVAEFHDKKNDLLGVITFGRVEGAPASSPLNRPDAVSGTIYRTAVHGSAGVAAATTDSKLHIHRSKSTSGGKGLLVKAFSLRPTMSTNAIAASDANGTSSEGVRIPVASCRGNWLSHLDWGEYRVWTLAEEPVHPWEADPNPLPSDCRFREDLRLLAVGDVEGAQAAKERLENQQRADAKLRKGGG